MKTFFPLLLFSALFFTACGSDECDTGLFCNTTYPDTGTLTVKVSIDAQNLAVPIFVYYGYVEDSSLYFVDTLTEQKVSYTVTSDQKYSVAAYYRRDNDRIIAIDGDDVDVSSEENCDETCYKLHNGTIDVRLR